MTEQKAVYYVSKAPKPLRRLDSLRVRFQTWLRELPLEERWYTLGLLVAGVAGVCRLVGQGDGARMLFVSGAVIFAYGVVVALTSAYERAWRTLPGKVAIASIVALATNVAHGFGRQCVAGIIGTDPAPFGETITTATILVSPVLFLFALAMGGVILIILGVYACTAIGYWELLSGERILSRRLLLWACRVAAILIATLGAYWLQSHSKNYTKWVEDCAAGYLYHFDMCRDTYYATAANEKVAVLADGRILVGTPKATGGGYTFVARSATDRIAEER